MDLIRFDASAAKPLEGGKGASFIPVMEDDRLVAMMLRLDPKGDTGKRQVAMNVMLVVTVGEGNVRSGGTIAEVHAGDVVVLPGGLMHHIWTGPTGMDCILVTR